MKKAIVLFTLLIVLLIMNGAYGTVSDHNG